MQPLVKNSTFKKQSYMGETAIEELHRQLLTFWNNQDGAGMAHCLLKTQMLLDLMEVK